MKAFTVSTLKERESTIAELGRERSKLNSKPSYQRQGEIWSDGKRQLFIDSIINRFDIPKLYFHDVTSPPPGMARGYKYAIVDGKQRLEAIWSFLDDEFRLSDEFEFIEQPSLKGAGLSYSKLPPKLQARIDNYELPIQVIETEDVEWVEELFCRLNEAVALNAPERRNALRGPLPPIIRSLPSHAFFREKVPFTDNRYKHLDLATKFLYLEHRNGPTETKKSSLDDFVIKFREDNLENEAKTLHTKVLTVLNRLAEVFGEGDPLLASLGYVVVCYLLERDRELSRVEEARALLSEFDSLRRQVRSIMKNRAVTTELDNIKLDPELVEFERLSQSPNDVAGMKFRMTTLVKYLHNPKLAKSKLKELASAKQAPADK